MGESAKGFWRESAKGAKDAKFGSHVRKQALTPRPPLPTTGRGGADKGAGQALTPCSPLPKAGRGGADKGAGQALVLRPLFQRPAVGDISSKKMPTMVR